MPTPPETMTDTEIIATLIAAHRLVRRVCEATKMRPSVHPNKVYLNGVDGIQFMRRLGARPGAWYGEPPQRNNNVTVGRVKFGSIERKDEEIPYVKDVALEARVDEIVDEVMP